MSAVLMDTVGTQSRAEAVATVEAQVNAVITLAARTPGTDGGRIAALKSLGGEIARELDQFAGMDLAQYNEAARHLGLDGFGESRFDAAQYGSASCFPASAKRWLSSIGVVRRDKKDAAAEDRFFSQVQSASEQMHQCSSAVDDVFGTTVVGISQVLAPAENMLHLVVHFGATELAPLAVHMVQRGLNTAVEAARDGTRTTRDCLASIGRSLKEVAQQQPAAPVEFHNEAHNKAHQSGHGHSCGCSCECVCGNGTDTDTGNGGGTSSSGGGGGVSVPSLGNATTVPAQATVPAQQSAPVQQVSPPQQIAPVPQVAPAQQAVPAQQVAPPQQVAPIERLGTTNAITHTPAAAPAGQHSSLEGLRTRTANAPMLMFDFSLEAKGHAMLSVTGAASVSDTTGAADTPGSSPEPSTQTQPAPPTQLPDQATAQTAAKMPTPPAVSCEEVLPLRRGFEGASQSVHKAIELVGPWAQTGAPSVLESLRSLHAGMEQRAVCPGAACPCHHAPASDHVDAQAPVPQNTLNEQGNTQLADGVIPPPAELAQVPEPAPPPEKVAMMAQAAGMPVDGWEPVGPATWEPYEPGTDAASVSYQQSVVEPAAAEPPGQSSWGMKKVGEW